MGSAHMRRSGYNHSEEKTVRNCSTQELCGFVHMLSQRRNANI